MTKDLIVDGPEFWKWLLGKEKVIPGSQPSIQLELEIEPAPPVLEKSSDTENRSCVVDTTYDCIVDHDVKW